MLIIRSCWRKISLCPDLLSAGPVPRRNLHDRPLTRNECHCKSYPSDVLPSFFCRFELPQPDPLPIPLPTGDRRCVSCHQRLNQQHAVGQQLQHRVQPEWIQLRHRVVPVPNGRSDQHCDGGCGRPQLQGCPGIVHGGRPGLQLASPAGLWHAAEPAAAADQCSGKHPPAPPTFPFFLSSCCTQSMGGRGIVHGSRPGLQLASPAGLWHAAEPAAAADQRSGTPLHPSTCRPLHLSPFPVALLCAQLQGCPGIVHGSCPGLQLASPAGIWHAAEPAAAADQCSSKPVHPSTRSSFL